MFPGYFGLPDAELKELWKNGLFSLDANVLLDLYRYSEDTRAELLKLLRKLNNRLWVTNRACYEYLSNRLSVIATQAKAYDEARKSLENIRSSFASSRGHPFIGSKLLDELSELISKLGIELKGRKESLEALLQTDEIQTDLTQILEGRVGAALTKEELAQICKLGVDRYKNKIPPGYMDEKKPEEDRKFGDLIMWFQLIEKAKADKKCVTLVTGDQKEDWWRIFNGRTIGPRPELIEEFKEQTGSDLQMLSLDRFMERASEELEEDVKKDAINEVKELREQRTTEVDATQATGTFPPGRIPKWTLSDNASFSKLVWEYLNRHPLYETQIDDKQLANQLKHELLMERIERALTPDQNSPKTVITHGAPSQSE